MPTELPELAPARPVCRYSLGQAIGVVVLWWIAERLIAAAVRCADLANYFVRRD